VRMKAPSGPEWIHEIKHDGYRLIGVRRGNRVRLFTRRGYDWTNRFPKISEALMSLKAESVTIDGEAVICGPDGISDFDKLHNERRLDQAFLYAFDLLELNGVDLRPAPLEKRKEALAKVLRRGDGVRLVEHMAGNGELIFKHACRIGLEGIVSKRRDLPYRSGRSTCWVKVKNPLSSAVRRITEGTF
jgi:bifunctional non-homologous end joining protein LigD